MGMHSKKNKFNFVIFKSNYRFSIKTSVRTIKKKRKYIKGTGAPLGVCGIITVDYFILWKFNSDVIIRYARSAVLPLRSRAIS